MISGSNQSHDANEVICVSVYSDEIVKGLHGAGDTGQNTLEQGKAEKKNGVSYSLFGCQFHLQSTAQRVKRTIYMGDGL